MIGRRLLHAAIVLAGISVLTFALMELAPGSYFDEAVSNPRISAQTIATLHARHGLDQPVWKRYGLWAASLLRGDGGVSIAYQIPVSSLVLPRAMNTILLATVGLVLSWLLALALGVAAATMQRRWVQVAVDAVNANLAAIPELALATALLLLAARTGWLSTQSLTLPAVVLGLSGVPSLLPHVASSLRAVAGATYLHIARAHGIRGLRLLWQYWIRSAIPALVPLAGLSLAGLLSSSLTVEIVTGWPGLGSLMLDAIAARDADVVTGIVMLSAAFLVAGNLLAELLLAIFDPRIRRPSP